MAAPLKTVVATGGFTPGLPGEVIAELIASNEYYIIGRTRGTHATNDETIGSCTTVYKVDLGNLRQVNQFAQNVRNRIKEINPTTGQLDYLLLNAAIKLEPEEENEFGSKWCRAYIMNCLSQHYLIHLLRDMLIASKTRIIFGSTHLVRKEGTWNNTHNKADQLEDLVKAGSRSMATGETTHDKVDMTYRATKLIQLLNAQYWRRQLAPLGCRIIVINLSEDRWAKFEGEEIAIGGRNLLLAFETQEFPDGPDEAARIFMGAHGLWWPLLAMGNAARDETWQDAWSRSQYEIEKEWLGFSD